MHSTLIQFHFEADLSILSQFLFLHVKAIKATIQIELEPAVILVLTSR